MWRLRSRSVGAKTSGAQTRNSETTVYSFRAVRFVREYYADV